MTGLCTDKKYFEECMLCPRNCGVNRLAGSLGMCRMGSKTVLSRAALHFWEEPCLSGTQGSGAVFFSGCSLHCLFCQNEPISRGKIGREISIDRLCDIFFELKDQGQNNVYIQESGTCSESFIPPFDLTGL